MSNGYSETKNEQDEMPLDLGSGSSGRRFVIAGVLVIFVLWGVLFWIFQDWRARHRALSLFGATEVATVVNPLTETVPPGVDPKTWKAAVADTRMMLETVTASGMLDRKAMEQLRDDLRARVARTSPETAIGTLSKLWDEMQAKAGPILMGRPSRPPFPPPRPKILGGKA